VTVAALIILGIAGVAWMIATGIRFRTQPLWGANAGFVALQFVVGLGFLAAFYLVTGQ
jgi:hypothetical protein